MTSGILKGEPLTDPTNLWWATSGPPDAKIVIVGEAWGSEEKARGGRPFVGQSGAELDRILADANLRRDDIFCTNLFNGQPDGNDLSTLFEPGAATVAGLRPSPTILANLERLYRQLDAFPRSLIIAAGAYPLWALTNSSGAYKEKGVFRPSGIMSLRGSQEFRIQSPSLRLTTTTPVLPIIHPTAILRQWSLRALTVHDLRTRVPLVVNGTGWTRPRPFRFDHRPSFARVVGQLSSWLHASGEVWISADIETKANAIITCIGFADSADYAISIPFVQIVEDGKARRLESYWSASEEIAILKLLNALFQAPHIKWIGQNFLYDYQYIHQEFGRVPKIAHDTLVAQNLLFPGTSKDLGHLSSLYCDWHRYWKDDSREWSNTGTLDQHLLYNCEDAARTWEIAMKQRQVMDATGRTPFWSFELFKFNLAWRMMRRGVRRDPVATQKVGIQIIERKFEVDRQLLAIAPQATVADSGIKSKSTWVSSPAQLRWLLYDLWGLPVQRDKKTKKPSTGKVALQALKDRFPRLKLFFELLAESRSLGVIYSNAIQAKANPDGRIHGSFNPAGTETFRWSSSKNGFNRGMNMQNIPAGGEDWIESAVEEGE